MRLVSGLAVRAMLFTDIEGSTSLVRRLGDRYEGVLERHNTIIQSAITARAGVEHSREGDSLFATFPTTSAALESALEAQCRIEQEPWPSDGRVRVRMGVHVGEVAESRAGLVGLAIHQAARIMSVGHGGQIVISADVVDKAGPLPPGTSVRSLGIRCRVRRRSSAPGNDVHRRGRPRERARRAPGTRRCRRRGRRLPPRPSPATPAPTPLPNDGPPRECPRVRRYVSAIQAS